jgi:hypothetical protein
LVEIRSLRVGKAFRKTAGVAQMIFLAFATGGILCLGLIFFGFKNAVSALKIRKLNRLFLELSKAEGHTIELLNAATQIDRIRKFHSISQTAESKQLLQDSEYVSAEYIKSLRAVILFSILLIAFLLSMRAFRVHGWE